jgi:carboxypeptidase D
MNGLFNENGPIQVEVNQQLTSNPYAWSQLADYFWIDQPVCVEVWRQVAIARC